MSAEEDALKTIKEVNELNAIIEHTQAEQTLIEEAIKSLDKGEQVEEAKLNQLGLISLSSSTQKLRLKGMLSNRKNSLSNYYSAKQSSLKLLEDLLKCPFCGGLGVKSHTTYHRSDGKVTPILRSESCPTCSGSGKATLRPKIHKMINTLIK